MGRGGQNYHETHYHCDANCRCREEGSRRTWPPGGYWRLGRNRPLPMRVFWGCALLLVIQIGLITCILSSFNSRLLLMRRPCRRLSFAKALLAGREPPLFA